MRRRTRVLLLVLGVAVVLWFVVNPPGRFGRCTFAWTTYNSIPRVLSDVQVRSDGELRSVPKTHALTDQQVQWLLDPMPEVLIIGTGWDGMVHPDLSNVPGCEVTQLKTPDAVRLYNRLKKSGKRVAIHLHSTC